MFDERVSWQRFSTRQRRAVGQSETGFESIAKSWSLMSNLKVDILMNIALSKIDLHLPEKNSVEK